MASDAEKYNAWKRSTLNRLTQKYHAEATKLFERNLQKHSQSVKTAIDREETSIDVHDDMLVHDLLALYRKHLRDVVWVGVSDGLREVTPEKKLGTWREFPIEAPVERTIVSLRDQMSREEAFNKAFYKILKRSRKRIVANSKRQVKKYLRNVREGYRFVMKQYLEDPDNGTPIKVFKEFLGEVLNKTKAQTETVFRTETTKYFNEARVSYFKSHTDVDFVQLFAVTDGRISAICESRHKYVIPIDLAGQKQYSPPFHPNCRTVQSPVITLTKSGQNQVRENLGSEFGSVHSDTSEMDFIGRRAPPVKLPEGWI